MSTPLPNDSPQTEQTTAYRSAPIRESERLLSLAESLLEKREATFLLLKKHEGRNTIAAMLGIVIGALAGIYLGVLHHGPDAATGFISGFVVLIAVYALFQILMSVLSGRVPIDDLRANLRRDDRALLELVAILRESQGSLAEREHWSTLQHAEFRVRLTRFEIGPDEKLGVPVKTKPASSPVRA
jgi:hypothetical protein